MTPKFTDVLKLVEYGWTVSIAVKMLGAKGTSYFYQKISEEQRLKLKMAKLSNGRYSASYRSKGYCKVNYSVGDAIDYLIDSDSCDGE